MGKASKRTYTADFKKQAIELAKEIGVTRAARQLGISDTNIHNWREKQKSGKDNYLAGNVESDQEELKRLRAEVVELRKVNHILKAAAAFFSRDHLK